AMLWSDVVGADLFLPQDGSGELRGLRDETAGRALLGAVGAPHGDRPFVRLIPVTPNLVPAAGGRVPAMSAPVITSGRIEGFIIVQRHAASAAFSARDLEGLARLAHGVGEILPRARARGGRSPAAWLERDMAAARQMQRQFLPRALGTNSAGVRVLAEYL